MVVFGVRVMSVGKMRVMRRFFVIARFMALRCFLTRLRGVLVMMRGRLGVMIRNFLSMFHYQRTFRSVQLKKSSRSF